MEEKLNMETQIEKSGLNELQISLLRMFEHNIPTGNIIEIKDMIVDHLSDKLLNEVDSIVEKKGIVESDYQGLDQRPYRKSK